MSTPFSLTTLDGLQLAGQYFRPPGAVKGVVVVLHGMGEHFGRYKHIAEFFESIEYATIGIDLRGHGNSQGKRGHSPAFNHLLHDIELLLQKTNDLFTELPVILYGHSLGGNLAANYVLRKKPRLKGLILSSPYFKFAFEPPKWKVKLAKLIVGIFPALTFSTELEQAALSRDPVVVETYRHDPLVHDKISASFFFSIHGAAAYALKHAMGLEVKTLAMHGTGDRITSVAGTKEFAQDKTQLVELKLWEGFYHELHNEKEKLQVFHYIADWMAAYCDDPKF